jgi:MFS transporter, DHA2 family, multidrug resistance protein
MQPHEPQQTPPRLGFEQWEARRLERLEKYDREVSRADRWTVLAALGMATGIELAGRTASGILLPDLQGNAGATLDQLSWVLIAYNTGYICSLGVSAGFVRSFGTRKLWMACLFLFGLGNLLTYFSHQLIPLLIARSIAGLGGGIFMVRSIVFFRELFPKKEMARAVTMFNSIVFSIKGLWPILMGALSDSSSWNNAFLTQIPFIALSYFLISRYMPQRIEPVEDLPPADYRGVGLLLSALVCGQIALSRGERDMWFESPLISSLLILSLLCFLAFFWWDSREDNANPVFHIRTILSQRTYTAAFGLVLLCGVFLGAGLYVIPQYLRILQPYNAQQTAVFFLVDTLGLSLGVSCAVWIGVPRFGGAKTAGLGVALFGLANTIFVFIWTDMTPGNYIGYVLLIHGIGTGLLLAGASLLSTGTLDRRFQNEAASSYFFLRQLGASLGVTAAAVLIDQRMTVHSSRLLDTANRLDPAVERVLRDFSSLIAARGNGTSVPNPGNYEIFQSLVVTQARLLAFIDICFCLAVAAGIGLIVVAVARWRQLHTVEHPHLTSIVGR